MCYHRAAESGRDGSGSTGRQMLDDMFKMFKLKMFCLLFCIKTLSSIENNVCLKAELSEMEEVGVVRQNV